MIECSFSSAVLVVVKLQKGHLIGFDSLWAIILCFCRAVLLCASVTHLIQSLLGLIVVGGGLGWLLISSILLENLSHISSRASLALVSAVSLTIRIELLLISLILFLSL